MDLQFAPLTSLKYTFQSIHSSFSSFPKPTTSRVVRLFLHIPLIPITPKHPTSPVGGAIDQTALGFLGLHHFYLFDAGDRFNSWKKESAVLKRFGGSSEVKILPSRRPHVTTKTRQRSENHQETVCFQWVVGDPGSVFRITSWPQKSSLPPKIPWNVKTRCQYGIRTNI